LAINAIKGARGTKDHFIFQIKTDLNIDDWKNKSIQNWRNSF
jgi:hypothetical protein